jgi:hypothetical protein
VILLKKEISCEKRRSFRKEEICSREAYSGAPAQEYIDFVPEYLVL